MPSRPERARQEVGFSPRGAVGGGGGGGGGRSLSPSRDKRQCNRKGANSWQPQTFQLVAATPPLDLINTLAHRYATPGRETTHTLDALPASHQSDLPHETRPHSNVSKTSASVPIVRQHAVARRKPSPHRHALPTAARSPKNPSPPRSPHAPRLRRHRLLIAAVSRSIGKGPASRHPTAPLCSSPVGRRPPALHSVRRFCASAPSNLPLALPRQQQNPPAAGRTEDLRQPHECPPASTPAIRHDPSQLPTPAPLSDTTKRGAPHLDSEIGFLSPQGILRLTCLKSLPPQTSDRRYHALG